MIIVKSDGSYIIDTVETRMFVIKNLNDSYTVEFTEHALALVKQVRYLAWFSAIDLVRRNVEVTLNARCNSKTDVNFVYNVVSDSVSMDSRISELAYQCFSEVGLL